MKYLQWTVQKQTIYSSVCWALLIAAVISKENLTGYSIQICDNKAHKYLLKAERISAEYKCHWSALMFCSANTNEVLLKAFSQHRLSKLQLPVYTLQHLKKVYIQTVTEQQFQIGNFILVTSLRHQICQFVYALRLQQFHAWVVKHVCYVCSSKDCNNEKCLILQVLPSLKF